MTTAELMTRDEAAQYLRVSPATLETWVSRGSMDLPIVKIGRMVRYRLEDLQKWVASKVVIKNKPESSEEETGLEATV